MNDLKPKAIYIGWSDHGCEAWYKCPVCEEAFGTWFISDGELAAGVCKCPFCHTELRGVE